MPSRINLVFNLNSTSELRDLCNALEIKEGIETKARLEGELEELIKKIETRQKERDILRTEIDTLRELYGLDKKAKLVEKADKAETSTMAQDRPIAMSDEVGVSEEPATAPSEGTLEI